MGRKDAHRNDFRIVCLVSTRNRWSRAVQEGEITFIGARDNKVKLHGG